MPSANEQGDFRDCRVATFHLIAASPEASCLCQEEQSSRLGPQCGGSKDGRKKRLSRARCTLMINSRCAGRGGESCGEGDIANDDDKEVLGLAPTLEVVSAAAAHTSQVSCRLLSGYGGGYGVFRQTSDHVFFFEQEIIFCSTFSHRNF